VSTRRRRRRRRKVFWCGREKRKLKKGRRKKSRKRGSSLSLSLFYSLSSPPFILSSKTKHALDWKVSRARTTFRAKNLRGMSPPRAERILTHEKETRRASRHGEKQRATRDFSLSLSPHFSSTFLRRKKKAEKRLLSEKRNNRENVL